MEIFGTYRKDNQCLFIYELLEKAKVYELLQKVCEKKTEYDTQTQMGIGTAIPLKAWRGP